jgi:hypothetical protein
MEASKHRRDCRVYDSKHTGRPHRCSSQRCKSRVIARYCSHMYREVEGKDNLSAVGNCCILALVIISQASIVTDLVLKGST